MRNLNRVFLNNKKGIFSFFIINIMRLTTVLGSVDNSPRYYKFIPFQIFFWNKINVKFICVFVGTEIPKE